ncbi:hypothetical protein H0H81_000308 [Sphagnurus paluster]|uniref:Cytochrome P450 n=1 Tax=Sphagnurus paluster TaxID=117069 RepID=A0A9P7GGI0_9AGAR|nr:hypothetical protein H0H81_000308 [Sphagnurus paluster]
MTYFFPLLVGGALVFLLSKVTGKKHPPLPPGPPAEPIIGHLRKIPAENQENVFHEWGKIYGWVRTVSFIGYGKLFQKHRRLLQEYLKASSCVSYQPIQIRETHMLLQNLLSDETSYDKFLRRVAYGHQVLSDDDTYVKITEGASHGLGNAGPPGSTPIDFFPFRQLYECDTSQAGFLELTTQTSLAKIKLRST